ncbi:MAG: LD-carboxypeptidase [Ignavibacteriae bacterium]|nr:MAG: LD-carboxypeptidase [Ignavibacteriota bacterium]
MALERRTFLQTIAGTAAATLALGSSHAVAASDLEPIPARPLPSLLPKALAPGSRVGIACPASGVTMSEMKGFMALCTAHGLEPVMGRNVSRRDGYLSASDTDRADELKEFVDDPTIDAIMCARGGYGVMRILPYLDYSAIREANKIIMGFSDITALLIAANQLSGVVTYHGPVASSTFDPFTADAFKRTVMVSPQMDPFQDERLTTIVNGVGRGRLTGGNLAMVISTLGTKYEIDTKGAILFLEEINEEPYRIDRMLTQLWLAGKLQQCNGIALGNFRNCESKGLSITGPSFTLKEVIQERTKDLGIPVVYGLPFGHVKSKLTIPLGIEAELDATSKTLRLLQPSVEHRI